MNVTKLSEIKQRLDFPDRAVKLQVTTITSCVACDAFPFLTRVMYCIGQTDDGHQYIMPHPLGSET